MTGHEQPAYRAVTHEELLALNALMSAERKTLEPMTNSARANWATDQMKRPISESTVATVAEHLGLPINKKRRTNGDGAVDHVARHAIREVIDVVAEALAMAQDDYPAHAREDVRDKLFGFLSAARDSLLGDQS